MNQLPSPKVLVAPLDWGLGHATRCVPIIRELLRQRCQVVLAAAGREKTLLQQEFPLLPMLSLPGYEITYAATGWGVPLKIVAQIPKLLSTLKKEQAWLQKVALAEGLDAVISDNRYGLYHSTLPSVFVTHQLCIQTPFGFGESLLQTVHYRYINRFAECWVPDGEGENNLAGRLSHPAQKPTIPLHYTGPLSRFQKKEAESEKHLLILLSGPEPQRTLLEEKVLADLQESALPVVLVRGLPGATRLPATNTKLTVYNHLPAAELAQLMATAFLVVGRCGYSTVMDLAALQKKSVLIPTPGQTEQEYLAGHLLQKGFSFCMAQKEFSLKKALAAAAKFPYRPFPSGENKLSAVVGAFVKKLLATKAASLPS